MNNDDFYSNSDPVYLSARNAYISTHKSVIENESAQKCTVWRFDSKPDVEGDECEELGDASVLFHGTFTDRKNSNLSELISSLNESEKESLMEAQLVSMAEPGSWEEFSPEPGDIVSVFPGAGIVIGYEILEVIDLSSCRYLLLREPAPQTIPSKNT